MNTVRKPLKKSILKGIGLFALILCLFLVGVQYFFLRSTLYTQYQNRMRNVLGYAASVIDADDMEECIRTDQRSEKYDETQKMLDDIKTRTGVHYLYAVIPLNTDPTDNMKNVIAAVTPEEYAEWERTRGTPDEYTLASLGETTGDAYSSGAAQKYLNAYSSDGISFFENTTEFGTDYTGMMILRNSAGEKVAALCVDFEVSEIRQQIRENLLDILIVVIILGLLFATIFMIWADRHIVQPIRTVEEDVVRLARKSHTSRNPDAMVYSAEEIKTGNEVESLAHAVENLSHDMRDYVKNLVEQEKELVRLNSVANRDALTHVGNRNAYEQYAENLQLKMTEGHIGFGILLMDPRGLSRINAQYGNDKGDVYLQTACRVICEVFRHSPVFRIGGDLFAVVLLGEDYMNRKALTEEAESIYFRSASDEKTPPWEQVSVTFGLAEYDENRDRTVKDVYDRAAEAIRGKKEWLKNDAQQGEET